MCPALPVTDWKQAIAFHSPCPRVPVLPEPSAACRTFPGSSCLLDELRNSLHFLHSNIRSWGCTAPGGWAPRSLSVCPPCVESPPVWNQYSPVRHISRCAGSLQTALRSKGWLGDRPEHHIQQGRLQNGSQDQRCALCTPIPSILRHPDVL